MSEPWLGEWWCPRCKTYRNSMEVRGFIEFGTETYTDIASPEDAGLVTYQNIECAECYTVLAYGSPTALPSVFAQFEADSSER